ncbi:unnamed protein product [Lota lota]
MIVLQSPSAIRRPVLTELASVAPPPISEEPREGSEPGFPLLPIATRASPPCHILPDSQEAHNEAPVGRAKKPGGPTGATAARFYGSLSALPQPFMAWAHSPPSKM